MAEINWKSQQEIEEAKQDSSPTQEEVNSMAIMELAELVSTIVTTEGGQ